MDDPEPPRWNMSQHLAAGMTAIAQIEADRTHMAPQPVCHHFSQMNPVDPAEVSVDAIYGRFVPLLAMLGVEFLPDRLEAWETVAPNAEWLQTRVPAILEASNAAGLMYEGWTWEPRDRQPISASAICVINNRTG